jgi:protein-L-isoaspartate(D-aspartate) O-methyltransferase
MDTIARKTPLLIFLLLQLISLQLSGTDQTTALAVQEKGSNCSSDSKMDFSRLRKEMVARTIQARGISNKRVLDAMNAVKREEFVPTHSRSLAYEDSPLPIGAGQTISQPYIVALMADAMKIKPGDRVLEVGTGCGYAAAVLGHLAKDVYTIERIEELGEAARERLKNLGYNNIHVHIGDGTVGVPSAAPFNAITVAASGPRIPKSLVSQLAEGGRIVIPIENDSGYQDLLVGTKQGDQLKVEDLGGVRFVPLIGEEGYVE